MAKFLCVKTVSDKVVRQSFAYRSVYKWLVGDAPFYAKIWRMLNTPLQNADFQYIFACSASAVTPSKNVQLRLIGSPLRAFQCAQDEHRTLPIKGGSKTQTIQNLNNKLQ